MRWDSLVIRLWRKTEYASGCWIWKGSTNGVYGVIYGNGKRQYTHRLSWEIVHGPIPSGLFIDHKCGNKLCINPDHLQLVTPKENQYQSTTKTTAVAVYCVRGHPLSEADEYRRKNGHRLRICPVCSRIRKDKYLFNKVGRIPGINRHQKLDAKTAIKISQLYGEGHLSQTAIGKIFGVSNQTVSNIVTGKQQYGKWAPAK